MNPFNARTLAKLALAAFALTTAQAGTAAAQDYNDWSSISPYGLEMQDEYGNIHYVDPYAYDSQADIYGNVYSDYSGTMDPAIGMYDLTPAWQDNSYGGGYNTGSAYEWSEYDSSAYTSSESSNWAPGGLYDTSWMFE
ncbi:MAG: hypothetical protein AAF253_04815 [Pseudomonadota bacterium]